MDTIWTLSKAIEILKKQKEEGLPLRLAFLDIDLTMSGNPKAALAVREKLMKGRYVTIFVTSRTEEMVMSKKEYEKSKQYGFSRPQPKLEMEDNGKMIHAFIDEIPSQKGLYDPEIIIGTTGSVILIKQRGGGYKEDEDFKSHIGETSQKWRDDTLEVVKALDPENQLTILAAVDTEGNYEKGVIDVEEPDYRIQINIQGKDPDTTLKNKVAFFEKLKKIRDDKSLNIRITDDSYPDKGLFALYLTPYKVWKATAVQHIIDKIEEELEIEPKELETFFAGDGYPDMRMGLEAGIGTRGVFLIVGGSRLSDALLGKTKDFAGITLEDVRERMREVGKGRYVYEIDKKDTEVAILKRQVIIGDVAYLGTKGPETILAYFDKYQ